jgi:hypothetical protein
MQLYHMRRATIPNWPTWRNDAKCLWTLVLNFRDFFLLLPKFHILYSVWLSCPRAKLLQEAVQSDQILGENIPIGLSKLNSDVMAAGIL